MSLETSGSASLLTHQAADLHDPRVRETIIAAARGIAERTGVKLKDITCATLIAIGLLAELRRSTDHWHVGRFGTHLWRAGPDDDRPTWTDDHG